MNGENTKIWFCKIGEVQAPDLPKGSDLPMRQAIAEAYLRITGQEPKFIFSGWGAVLTEPERAAHENRLPEPTPETPQSSTAPIVHEYADHWGVLDANGGTIFMQRKPPRVASQDPLTDREAVIVALCEHIAAARSATLTTEHWVFAAAEKHRSVVEGLVGCEADRKHLLYMLDRIKLRSFSPTKACRWLGWIQGVLNEKHALTLDEAKAINKAASEAATDGSATK